jgi:hypothetical protein
MVLFKTVEPDHIGDHYKRCYYDERSSKDREFDGRFFLYLRRRRIAMFLLAHSILQLLAL